MMLMIEFWDEREVKILESNDSSYMMNLLIIMVNEALEKTFLWKK